MPVDWDTVLLAAVPSTVATFILCGAILFFYCSRKKKSPRWHHVRATSALTVDRSSPPRTPVHPFFDWQDHPALIAEAVEQGWAAFRFVGPSIGTSTGTSPCPPTNSNSLWTTIICSQGCAVEPHSSRHTGLPVCSALHVPAVALCARLPLPGPALGGALSFPQNAYFEVTFTPQLSDLQPPPANSFSSENERANLLSKKAASDPGSDEPSLPQILSALSDTIASGTFALGLTVGQKGPPCELPGSHLGSVGFHSDGNIYLDGASHIGESSNMPLRKHAWGGGVDATVGCGFEPIAKRVYFTLDGELVCEILTTRSEFGSPLYPAIASDYNVSIWANFGQALFQYAPANAQRITDPCFLKQPLVASVTPAFRSSKHSMLYEDSGELFSMGRIDSQYLESPCSQDLQARYALSESESDLFEIVLDGKT